MNEILNQKQVIYLNKFIKRILYITVEVKDNEIKEKKNFESLRTRKKICGDLHDVVTN